MVDPKADNVVTLTVLSVSLSSSCCCPCTPAYDTLAEEFENLSLTVGYLYIPVCVCNMVNSRQSSVHISHKKNVELGVWP